MGLSSFILCIDVFSFYLSNILFRFSWAGVSSGIKVCDATCLKASVCVFIIRKKIIIGFLMLVNNFLGRDCGILVWCVFCGVV